MNDSNNWEIRGHLKEIAFIENNNFVAFFVHFPDNEYKKLIFKNQNTKSLDLLMVTILRGKKGANTRFFVKRMKREIKKETNMKRASVFLYFRIDAVSVEDRGSMLPAGGLVVSKPCSPH